MIQIRIIRPLRLLCFLTALLLTGNMMGQESNELISKLQAEMYKYFSTPEQEKFLEITEQLKTECLKAGDEQLFYKAWGNQAIYAATHQHRNRATEIAKEMKEYAKEKDSRFGEYTALHVTGSVLLQMRNYEEAEATFLEAIEYLRSFFEGQSAAAEYLELVTISNRRNDIEKGKKYARMVLTEPGLQPQHKVRAYSMLCQYAYLEDKREEFNELYTQWIEATRETAPGSLKSTVETEYNIINGRYEEALQTAKQIPVKTRNEIVASIYSKMGDYATAYKYLREWIHEKDSINQQDQASIFSDYIIQSQNERLENERLALEDQNHRLRARFFITLVCAIAVILLLLVYQRHRRVERLKEDNMALDKARGEAEKARNQAEKALDVKREFLNNISHELRTPLNPITGFSDILATPEYELQNEERATMSQHIKESSQLLTRIVDHMVELSFYESKQSLPMDSPISPNIICHHMIDAMEPLCPENVHLEFDSKLLSSVRITTNIEGVEKVLAHLIENAFNFTKSGTVTLQCEQQGDKVMIAVADTGCGVAPEQQDTVLELFAATQDRVKTTGMGLSISQAILKLLNGRLWLDKEYKAGARFVFELPIGGTKS